jgi:excinuclease ABC subunit B
MFDVLVGINLVREGLVLPEVSLVAFLDAEKVGFLRNRRSLIQTIGRAARNVSGQVLMYADKMTDSMRIAIDETSRRREVQMAFNTEHGIEPQTIRKTVNDIMQYLTEGEEAVDADALTTELTALGSKEAYRILASLEDSMAEAAASMDFEQAANLRDQAVKLRSQLEGTDESAVLDKLRSTARTGSKYGARRSHSRSRK